MKIHLPSIQVCFVGLRENEDRWGRIGEWTEEHCYKHITQFRNEKNTSLPKYGDVRLKFMEALASLTTFPSVIFEDDAMPTEWYTNELEVPDGAGIVYLGGSRYGTGSTRHGIKQNIEREILPYERDDRFGKIVNMMATHAILFTTKEARDDLMCIIEDDPFDNLCHDFGICLAQKYFDMLVLRKPLFYQKDGNNDSVTNIEL